MSFSSIAFGGGGVRGGLHVGGLAALEKHQGHLNFPDGIYGTSVGAIIATAVAFGLKSSQMKTMLEEYFSLSSIVPSLNLAALLQFNAQKGAFTMDLFGETIEKAFQSQGIELKGKVIGDAPQKLFIIASNMTTRRSTLLSGDVPILEALKCSSCIPFVFHPQVLYNQVYIDGCIFASTLHGLIPDDCLLFHISYPDKPLFPADLSDLTIVDMLRHIYVGKRKVVSRSNIIQFQTEDVQILQVVSTKEKQMLFDLGYRQTLRFLDSKRAPEEVL
jgi:hypothetical protein